MANKNKTRASQLKLIEIKMPGSGGFNRSTKEAVLGGIRTQGAP